MTEQKTFPYPVVTERRNILVSNSIFSDDWYTMVYDVKML